LELTFPPWFWWLRRWRLLHAVGFTVFLEATVVYAALGIPIMSATFFSGEFVALLAWAVPERIGVSFRISLSLRRARPC
jgi:hypothetical protein